MLYSENPLSTCLFASEVVTPLLLTLGRTAKKGTNAEQHLNRERNTALDIINAPVSKNLQVVGAIKLD